DLLDEQRITHTLIPPSLLASVPQRPLPHLTTLLVGAEACPTELVNRWAPGRRMLNAYGPTEITVAATLSTPLTPHTPPPIGAPLPNTRIHILDQHLQPVPPGVAGELYIAGIGLARGYHHQPALTATRFLANPHHTDTPGARLYRTGDLARWNTHGETNRPANASSPTSSPSTAPTSIPPPCANNWPTTSPTTWCRWLSSPWTPCR
ncbi:AMP-binding protein, partial [Streptomyces noursei]